MTARTLIGSVAQIPKGEGRVFAAVGQRVAVFHTQSGEVFATQAECPHLQGPLADGLTGGTTVVCPLHDRAYDLRTGLGLNGETTCLRVYPASLDENGKIWLSMPARATADRSDGAMKTFIRITEIWVPSEDRTELRYLDGLYGSCDEFRALSQQMRFRYDEGLPGKAWKARHPIIFRELEDSNFKRIEAARAIGLTCGVALPIFAGDLLKAVVVFLCGDSTVGAGAMELWHNDPGKFFELRLVDGYYGPSVMFEFNSRHTGFPRGYGLPGRAWKSNMPLIVKDLHDSKVFLRWKEALEIGVNRGLGIPYPHPSGETWVMTFLSARDTPIARRFEIWVPNQQQDALIFQAGDCDQNAELATGYKSARIEKGDGAIAQAWVSGVASVRASLAHEKSVTARSAAAAGLNTMVALPFMNDQELKAIVVWYF
jgi:nitrite reductase/ring-hydroxylating ferredoxin subunit